MQDLKNRYKKFAIETGELILQLPKSIINNAYMNQLIRSSSSPGTNYRAACRAKSMPDFINKLKIVEEELDETMFFYEMIAEFNSESKKELRELFIEANQLLSIIVASINTTNSNIIKENVQKIRNPKSKI